jgi:ribosomal protein S18 acetylase RimI-like enzyme
LTGGDHQKTAGGLTVRPYGARDREAVIELWQACGLIVPWNNAERDIDRKLRVNPEFFLIGEIEGEVAATCMAGYEGHRGWVNYLAVSPEHRRRGIGRLMMEAAEERLIEAGCPKLNVQIRTANRDVAQFYKSIGYRTDDVLSMGKRLEEDGPCPPEAK